MKTKIAIAGDHEEFREGLSSLLALHDFVVLYTVSNGAQLIQSIKANRPLPDICIVDYRMPQMDGIDTTTYIKSNWPFIKVVMYTMAEKTHIRERAMQAGADQFVFKGAEISELYASLKACAMSLT